MIHLSTVVTNTPLKLFSIKLDSTMCKMPVTHKLITDHRKSEANFAYLNKRYKTKCAYFSHYLNQHLF